MSIHKKGLVLAIEDISFNERLESDHDDISVVQHKVDQSDEALYNADEVVDMLIDVIDDVEADADALDSTNTVISQVLSEGDTPSSFSLRIAEESLRTIHSRLGIPYKAVATEDLKSKTEITVEGISTTLTRIWEAIRRALDKMWDGIVAITEAIYDKADNLRILHGKLGKEVNALAGKTCPETISYIPAIVAFGSGKDVTVTEIISIIKNHQSLQPKLEKTTASYDKLTSDFTAKLRESDATQADFNSITAASESRMLAIFKDEPGSTLIFGTKIIAEDKDGTLVITTDVPQIEITTNDVPVANMTQLKQILDMTRINIRAIVDVHFELSKISKLRSSTDKMISDIIHALESGSVKEISVETKNYLKTQAAFTANAFRTIRKIQASCVRESLGYVNACVRSYGHNE